MPLYEYHCTVDGTFEQMQKFSDPPLTTCPKCGGPVEKLLSAPAIQFKGSGWYITDYARKSSSDSGKEKGDSGKEKGSSEKPSEQKAGESSPAKDTAKGSATTPTPDKK